MIDFYCNLKKIDCEKNYIVYHIIERKRSREPSICRILQAKEKEVHQEMHIQYVARKRMTRLLCLPKDILIEGCH
jgi:hypothetical protein